MIDFMISLSLFIGSIVLYVAFAGLISDYGKFGNVIGKAMTYILVAAWFIWGAFGAGIF